VDERDAVCRLELSMALMEAALESGVATCEMLVFKRPADGAAETHEPAVSSSRSTSAAAVDVARRRMDRQASISRPVSSEVAAWFQGLVLMLIGMLLSIFFGWNKSD
jgi:hypothetical protein